MYASNIFLVVRNLFHLCHRSADQVSRAVSISAPPPTNARGLPTMSEITDENFFSKMDSELTKVEKHTLKVVTDLRAQIQEIEDELQGADLEDQTTVDRIQAETDAIAGKFLTLEKYVNLNFMGRLPFSQCAIDAISDYSIHIFIYIVWWGCRTNV